MKYSTPFIWLFLIVFIDTWLSGMLLPVTIQLVSVHDIGDYHRAPTILNDSILASGIIFLLSPSSLLSAPVIGWCCDIIGRKKSLIICLFCALFGYGLLYISSALQSVLFAFLGILLINADASMIAIQTMIIDTSHSKRRAYYLGLIVMVMLPIYLWSSQTFSAISSLTTLNQSSIQSLLIVIAIISSAIIVFFTIKCLQETTPVVHARKDGQLELYYSFKRVLLNKKLIVLLALLGVLQFGCGIYFESVTKYLIIKFNYHSQNLKLLNDLGILVLSVAMVLVYPILLRYLSLNKILLLSLSLCAAGALGSVIVPLYSMQLICYSLLSMGEGIGIGVIWMMLADASHPLDRGLVMGIKGAVWSLSWSFSVTLGHMLDHVFYFDAPLEISTLILLSGVLLAYASKLNRSIEVS